MTSSLENVVQEFQPGNRDGYVKAVTDLVALKQEEEKSGPKAGGAAWNNDLKVINSHVNLTALGFRDAGEILDVTANGRLVTSDENGGHVQERTSPNYLLPEKTTDIDRFAKKLDAELRKQSAEDKSAKFEPGDHTISLMVDGKARTFDVHIPRNDGKEKLGVMYMIDGVDLNDQMRMRGETRIEEITKKDKMVIVYPHALFKNLEGPLGIHVQQNAWNSAHSGLSDWDSSYDDSRYFNAVMRRVNSSVNIDPTRQYLCGFSEGGEVISELAKEHPHTFAGLIPIMPTKLPGIELPASVNDPTAVVISISDNTVWTPLDGGPGYITSRLERMKQSRPKEVFTDWTAANGYKDSAEEFHDDPHKRQVRQYQPTTTGGAPVIEWMRDYSRGWFGGGTGQHAIDGPGAGGLYLIGEKDRSYDVTQKSWDIIKHYRKVDGKIVFRS